MKVMGMSQNIHAIKRYHFFCWLNHDSLILLDLLIGAQLRAFAPDKLLELPLASFIQNRIQGHSRATIQLFQFLL